jgi:hypothetical protein
MSTAEPHVRAPLAERVNDQLVRLIPITGVSGLNPTLPGYDLSREVLVIGMTSLAGLMREDVTRSAAQLQGGRAKSHKVASDLRRLAHGSQNASFRDRKKRTSEMRQIPATDRSVRHRPDTQPEGESWVSMKISRE